MTIIYGVFLMAHIVIGTIFIVFYFHDYHKGYVPNLYTLCVFIMFWPLVELFQAINEVITKRINNSRH